MPEYIIMAIPKGSKQPYYLYRTKLLKKYRFISNFNKALSFRSISFAVTYVNTHFMEVKCAYQKSGQFTRIGVGLLGGQDIIRAIR